MADDYYGAPVGDDTQTLGQRLRTYYAPEDFVTVINVDTQPIKYQFTNPSDIETFSDYPGHKDTIVKRPPTVVILQPGETKLCPAHEADLMIENLIKQITNKKIEHDIEEGKAVSWQSANWTDPVVQKSLIEQIFVGKKDIVGSYNQSLEAPDVKGDLEDNDESTEPIRRGRPSKAIQSA